MMMGLRELILFSPYSSVSFTHCRAHIAEKCFVFAADTQLPTS
jgi:hypothetical protein